MSKKGTLSCITFVQKDVMERGDGSNPRQYVKKAHQEKLDQIGGKNWEEGEERGG